MEPIRTTLGVRGSDIFKGIWRDSQIALSIICKSQLFFRVLPTVHLARLKTLTVNQQLNISRVGVSKRFSLLPKGKRKYESSLQYSAKAIKNLPFCITYECTLYTVCMWKYNKLSK